MFLYYSNRETLKVDMIFEICFDSCSTALAGVAPTELVEPRGYGEIK